MQGCPVGSWVCSAGGLQPATHLSRCLHELMGIKGPLGNPGPLASWTLESHSAGKASRTDSNKLLLSLEWSTQAFCISQSEALLHNGSRAVCMITHLVFILQILRQSLRVRQ